MQGNFCKMEGGLRKKGFYKRHSSHKPLVTVIMVVLNGGKCIEETIKSVINQSYDNTEYIIIDGGSTDGTLKIIETYENHIDYWISEKDNGIYDAMNKGLKLADENNYVNFLNVGDTFYSEKTLEKIFSKDNSQYDLIYGDTVLNSAEGRKVRYLKAGHLNEKSIIKGMILCHQAIFVRKSKTPSFNTGYKIRADYNWVIDLIKIPDLKIKYLNFPIIYYSLGGYSQKHFFDNFKEYLQILFQRFGYLHIVMNVPRMMRMTLGFYIRKILNVDTLRFWNSIR